ncbi:hypothetical protein D3C85_1432550 [compost metagenome]
MLLRPSSTALSISASVWTSLLPFIPYMMSHSTCSNVGTSRSAARSISAISSLRLNNFRQVGSTVCQPKRACVTPMSANATLRSRVTLVILNSKENSSTVDMSKKRCKASPTSLMFCGESSEGVPPPKNIALTGTAFKSTSLDLYSISFISALV